MPNKFLYPCKAPMCPNDTNGKSAYCSEHFKERETEVNYTRDPFYHSTEWRKLRAWYIKNNPLCVVCNELGRVVDHIIPISQGGERYDINNLQTMCDMHHNKKRAYERKALR